MTAAQRPAPHRDAGLAEVLRQPGFGDALRAAITRRDLPLERIRTRLAARGIAVSVSTLSYWQQGRSRPERPRSLQALRVLEEVLELPEGTLFDFLEAPKPRGRDAVTDARLPYRVLFGDDSAVRAVLGEDYEFFNDDLVVLSVSESCHLDASRSVRRLAETVVCRAAKDGAHRFTTVYSVDDGEVMPSGVEVRGGTLGEVRVDHHNGCMVVETLLGRALAKNDTVILEHEFTMEPSEVPTRVRERRTSTPLHGFTQRVHFAPDTLPARSHRYYRPSVVAHRQNRHRLAVDATSSVHTFLAKCPPGVYGISWEWE